MLVFVFSPLQAAFGMWGLAATEIGLFAIAASFSAYWRQGLSKAFPLPPLKLRYAIATALLVLSCAFVSIPAATLLATLFPRLVAETSAGLSGFVSAPPAWIAFLCVALLPACCEEALFRGTVWEALKPWAPAARVLLCGFLFGLFHLDLARLLPTAVIGLYVSYLRLKTNSIAYSAIFHAANNSYILAFALFAGGAGEAQSAAGRGGAAAPLAFGGIGLALLFAARRALGRAGPEGAQPEEG
jgi:membrane protease YdiL (CAAX protease family)